MAKKSPARTSKAKRTSTTKRDLVRRPGASGYAKRTSTGRFKDVDDVGRSQSADKPRRAKKQVRSGYGDQGDRTTRAAKKR